MYYKFLRLEGKKIKSNSGDCVWKKGEWKHEDKIDMCNSGFHCSSTILDAFYFVQGEILAQVEVKGKKESREDKSVHSDMRLVKIWNWTKKDSVALSIFSAELVIKNYEKLYPNDNRPRLAIEATKKVLENDTEKNRSAARSAWSAASAARSGERSAEKDINIKINKWLISHLKEMKEYK